MEHIENGKPSLTSVALPFLLGVAAASVFSFVLHAADLPGAGAQECLATRPLSTEGHLANSGKTRPVLVTFAMGTPVIMGQDRLRAGSSATVASPVSYIRCLRKTS